MSNAGIPTVIELVTRAQITRNTLYNWEGGVTAPALDELEKVARTLDVPLSVLVDAWSGRQQKKEPPPKWAGAMEQRIVSEVQANRATITEALAVTFAEWADRIDRERREGNADATPDGTGDQPPGGAEPEPEPAT
jgi:transcriptional regulator with XRE-family HTH domain